MNYFLLKFINLYKKYTSSIKIQIPILILILRKPLEPIPSYKLK
jgi:hypothetical protein